jgi:eukaryotic-like serine/threonine-protein kinase
VAMRDGALLSLAESVADGSPVDWDAAEASADPDDVAIVKQLRVVAQLATLHRSLPANPADLPTRSHSSKTGPVAAIGRWAHLELMERIGAGAFGEVYRAWDPHLEREVALKLLSVADSHSDLAGSRVAREGRLLARIRHANVVTVYGVAVHEGRVGLWMELVRGETLETLLDRRGPLSAREAALVGIDICRAIAAIHAAGLVHRDVKAQNVMREEGGRIVLMDFGAGREVRVTPTSGLPDWAGTPLYLAPEIFDGAPATERTDLYSLGVLLYRLVTGSFPVRATAINELRRAHKTGTVVRLRDARPNLPTRFVAVIDRAIAREPDRRYATAGELERDLVSALDESPVTTIKDAPRRSTTLRRRAVVVAGAVAATVLALAIAWPALRTRPAPAGAPGTPIKSIAVLPLANLSGDPTQEYFADGITDELIAAIGESGQLNVISRTSAMHFKGVHEPLPEIAKRLHVDAVLEGSVLLLPGDRSDPDGSKRVRINARLILAGTDTQLWNRTFERVVDDVLALQSEVATAVVEGLNQRLNVPARGVSVIERLAPRLNVPAPGSVAGAIEGAQPPVVPGRARAQNFEAYDFYLKGRYFGNHRTREVLERSVRYFQEAIAREPRFAAAYAGLADAYNLLGMYGFMRRAEALALSSEAASKALSLDPQVADAHLSLALVHEDHFEWQAAESRFKRALELNPGLANAHYWYADYLAIRGRLPEAMVEIERARALDPLSMAVNTEYGSLLLLARRYDEAIVQLQTALQSEPTFARAYLLLAEAHAHKRAYGQALAAADRAAALGTGDIELRAGIGYIYAVAGRPAQAMDIARELEARYQRKEDAALGPLGAIYAGLNDRDRAFEWLDRARELLDTSVDYLILDPRFDPLRTDPRFAKLLAGMGLT